MKYTYKNVGTCSRETIIDMDADHIINDVQIIGGCDGNLKGISALLKGAKAEDVISRLTGVTCGMKPTSCPDQIAQALRAAIEQQNNQ